MACNTWTYSWTYGYEILEKLKENQFPEISDGSIYPVLVKQRLCSHAQIG